MAAARGRVQGPDRARSPRIGALDHTQLAVPHHVGQRRAAPGGPVQGGAPDLVARGVVRLDRVLVAGTWKETARTGHDAVGTAGQDRADGGGGVDLLVRGGAADQPAVVVVDPHVAAVGVVGAEGEPVGLRPPGDEVVRPGAVEVPHGRGGEHTVGGELRPPGGGRAAPAREGVGHLPQRTPLHERPTVAERERCLHTTVGHGVAGRVGDDLVPHRAASGRVGVVATVDGRGGVAGAEVEVAPVGVVDRSGRVDGRAPGDLEAVGAEGRRAATRVRVGAPLARADGLSLPAAPARGRRSVGEVERVQHPLAVTDLDRRSPAGVELHRRGLDDPARRVVEHLAPHDGHDHW